MQQKATKKQSVLTLSYENEQKIIINTLSTQNTKKTAHSTALISIK